MEIEENLEEKMLKTLDFTGHFGNEFNQNLPIYLYILGENG